MRIKEMISVGMLFLIISHGIIQFVFFKIFQAKYQAEIVEIILNDLSETELVSFKFNRSDLNSGTINIQWLKDDEFRYQNIVYDVFKKEVNGDCIYLYCVLDENESKLYSNFDKYFQKLINEDSDKEEDLESLCYSFSQLYSKPLETEHKSSEYSESKYFTITPFNILDGVHPSSTPPPRS